MKFTASLVTLLIAVGKAQQADLITPSCDAISILGSNDCGLACRNLGEEIDFRRSRDVNGRFKCYCTSITVCNDDPACSDLLIVPGDALAGCQDVCGSDTTAVDAQDDVEYTGEGANKNQTHFRVNCFCDDVKQCDTEYILFSDLSFLPACSSSSSDPGKLNINSEAECVSHCSEKTFEGATYDAAISSCTCTNPDGTAVACDDSKANSQRPDFIGCFEEVGVSAVSCPPTEAPTMKSTAAITASTCFTVLVSLCSIILLSTWMLV